MYKIFEIIIHNDRISWYKYLSFDRFIEQANFYFKGYTNDGNIENLSKFK